MKILYRLYFSNLDLEIKKKAEFENNKLMKKILIKLELT